MPTPKHSVNVHITLLCDHWAPREQAQLALTQSSAECQFLSIIKCECQRTWAEAVERVGDDVPYRPTRARCRLAHDSKRLTDVARHHAIEFGLSSALDLDFVGEHIPYS